CGISISRDFSRFTNQLQFLVFPRRPAIDCTISIGTSCNWRYVGGPEFLGNFRGTAEYLEVIRHSFFWRTFDLVSDCAIADLPSCIDELLTRRLGKFSDLSSLCRCMSLRNYTQLWMHTLNSGNSYRRFSDVSFCTCTVNRCNRPWSLENF